MKYQLLFILLIFVSIYLSAVDKENYEHISKDNMNFYWSVSEENLNVIVNAPTKGWIAIGIDPDFKMKGADYIIGYVKNDEVFIADHYGVAFISHKPDIKLGGTDNILNASGIENDEVTELSFSIPLDSKDKYDKVIKEGKHKILLAFGLFDNYSSKHVVYTSVEIDVKIPKKNTQP